MQRQTRPQVLVLSGLDPSGGAGIQADIQAITAMGAHPLPVVTCLTVQDTRNVYGAEPVSADLIRRQLEALREDTPIHAIKTGALGNSDIVRTLVDFLATLAPTPLVVDPVIKAAGGGQLADQRLWESMREALFPHADVVTPNGPELVELGGNDDEDQAAAQVLTSGCAHVLATGGHGTGDTIENRLYAADGTHRRWELKRVGGEYHGSGCTLAAAISAGLARGASLHEAIEAAQTYVAGAIGQALQVGQGQPVPNRGPLP